MEKEIQIGFVYRPQSHGPRAVYRPDWDPRWPWIMYRANGDAWGHLGSLTAAKLWIEGKK